MENQQYEQYNIREIDNKMPIKKVFTIIGIGLCASIILVNIVEYVCAYVFMNFYPQIYNSDFFKFGASTVPLTLIALPTLIIVTHFIPSVKIKYKQKLSFTQLFKIFVMSYSLMTVLNTVSVCVNLLISEITGVNATNPLDFIQNTNIFATLLFGVIISPIVEEIMFRYIIIKKLRSYGSGAAIFTSAFAFALYHGNLYQMLYAFAIGIILAAVYYKTNKIIYSIILHIVINLFGSVVALSATSKNLFVSIPCMMLLLAVGITGFILVILTLCKTDYSKIKQDIMPKQYLKPFFLNVGTISFVVITLINVVLFLLK